MFKTVRVWVVRSPAPQGKMKTCRFHLFGGDGLQERAERPVNIGDDLLPKPSIPDQATSVSQGIIARARVDLQRG